MTDQIDDGRGRYRMTYAAMKKRAHGYPDYSDGFQRKLEAMAEAVWAYHAPPRYLFLDIDGVVKVRGRLAGEPIGFLHHVIQETGCRIVLSSDWRLFYPGEGEAEQRIRDELGYRGPAFVGKTPDLMGPDRGLEIAAFLASQPGPVGPWAVVDDLPVDQMENVAHRLVRTLPRVGIDAVATEKLIALLTEW